MTSIEMLQLLQRLEPMSFTLFVIKREAGRYRCELGHGIKSMWGSLTVHSPEPLDWDHEYSWDELKHLPCWFAGDRIVLPKDKMKRRPVRKTGLYILEGAA